MHRRTFEAKRKAHYNEFLAVQKAKELLQMEENDEND